MAEQDIGASGFVWPTVTVIVPTYNRGASLAATLASLLVSDYPADRLETVVVDNSSTDDTERVVRAAQAVAPFPLRYVRKENEGPAAARNYGLTRSSGEIVGFTDSDCRVRPDWIRQAVQAMTPGVGLVAGIIRPVWPQDRQLGFFQHQLDAVAQEGPLYPTANAFYRREALERVGGFNEQFGAYRWGPPVGGEDTDLAWRVKRSGYRSAFAAAAVVEHEASPMSMQHWLLDPVRVQNFPRLLALNPELRQHLIGRYFVGPGTLTFYALLLGTVLGLRKSPLFLVLAAPWFWLMRGAVLEDLKRPSRWWRVPVKYGLLFQRSGTLTGALLFGAIRYRRLAL